jgi:predicted RNA methylase
MGEGSVPFAGGGYVTPFFDTARVEALAATLARVVKPGDTVLELGPGSGNISLIAAQYAKRVIAVEDDDSLHAIFASMLGSSTLTNIELVKPRTLLQFEPSETVDVLICELLSPALLAQPQAPVLNKFLRYLKPGGTVLPYGLTNTATLVEAEFAPYGIPFRFPYRERDDLPMSSPKTAPVVLNQFAFVEGLPEQVHEHVTMTAIAGGICNAIRVESIVSVGADLAIKGSPILCTPIVVPLLADVPMVASQRYHVEIAYEHARDVTDHPRFTATIEPADTEFSRRGTAAA